MKRWTPDELGMIPDANGEYIRYADHCEAMKRIAGAPATDEREAFEAYAATEYLNPATGTYSSKDGVIQFYGDPATQSAWRAWQARAAITPPRQMVADSAGGADVDRVARVLLAAWQKAEPDHPVSQYPESYLATFADMARAVRPALPSPAAQQKWRINVAGPAGYVRFETFHGATLDDALEDARKQGFAWVADEEGHPIVWWEAGLPERDTSKAAGQQGLFRKFDVRRTDGSDALGGKHHGCRYFVLDVDHDAFAAIALGAYAAACEATHPKLARDLLEEWGASGMNPKSDPIALWAEIHRLCALLKRKDFPVLKSLHAELDTLRWMSVVKDDPWDQAIEAVRKRIAQIIETESK